MSDAYVAIDLELLDPTARGQEILEIGAVRFRGSRIEDELSLVVRTRGPVSPRIAALTGIGAAELETAVPLAEALAALARFVGQDPIVGQSVELDIQHLETSGLSLRNPLLDTYDLATILLPGLPVYELTRVAETLGVIHDEPRHRALPDARLAMRVFLALVQRIERLDARILAEIARLGRPLDWPALELFETARRTKVGAASAFDLAATFRDDASDLLARILIPPSSRESLSPSEEPRPVSIPRLERSLSAGGDVASRLASFEERPEQLEMLRAVARAFNEGGTLLVEAGTGTGKSLAYLLPSVHFAAQNDRRVVVSTNTINLQDQLYLKDLPALRDALRLPFRYAVLKGRANYLCLRRWLTLFNAPETSADERRLLIKTLLWLRETRTGDRSELRLTRGEAEAWSKINAADDICTPLRCSYHRSGTCFLARARRTADSSHIVVVNHALLLADVAAESMVLPEYHHLVVDEAHHLEDEATAQLGWTLSQREIGLLLERVVDASTTAAASVVARSVEYLRKALPNSADQISRLESLHSSARATAEATRTASRQLFGLLTEFATQHASRGEGGPLTLRMTDHMRARPAWAAIPKAVQPLGEAILGLAGHLGGLQSLLELAGRGDETWEDLNGDLATHASLLIRAEERLRHAVVAPDPSMVFWLAINRGQDVEMHAAPLDVAELLRHALFGEKETLILTSATLAAAQRFDYVRERLGVPEPRELIVGSPFDYLQSTLLYLPADVPEPNQTGFQAAVERAIGSIIAALDGRTMVLFTSHSQLRATYQALKAPLSQRGITLLGQGMESSSRERLLQQFRQGERVALFGTNSFWEGVDVVGEALSCLVIARLPFTAPSDPVFQARGEAFRNAFNEYAVPQAVIRLRQGFGRLIRSQEDRGMVVMLDSRLTRRAYGEAFLSSLPQCTVIRGPVSQLASAARNWLSKAADDRVSV